MRMHLVAAAILGATMATASAQGGGGMAGRIAAMDLNHDGSITKAEARTARETEFRATDADHDGFISQAERDARRAQFAAMRPEGAGGKGKRGGDHGGGGHQDVNGDGKVSRDEFMNAPYRMFERIDTNHNDVLEAAELAAARTRALQMKQGTP